MLPTLTPIAPDCSRESLAQGPHCKVELCQCGVLHVTMGPVTFRTTRELAHVFLEVLHTAVHRLAARDLDDALLANGGWKLRLPRTPDERS